MQYLVLVPQSEPDTRILAPVENVERIGLREIITPETADELLETFSEGDSGLIWDDNHAKRRQAYVDILKGSSLNSLATLIRTLTLRTKLSNGDKELLPRARKRLFSEIALAKGMDFQRVADIAEHRMHLI